MASIEEALTFDISAALSSVDQLDAALSAVASNFTAAMNDASSAIGTVTIDDVDTSAVTSGIDDAVAAATANVPVTADAATVTADIDQAVAASSTTVDITADASDVTAEIEAAVAAADVTVTPTAAGTEGGGTKGGTEGINKAELALGALEAAGGAAEGSMAGVGGSLTALGPAGAAAAAGLGTVAATTKTLVTHAIEADAAERRLAGAFGGLAESVADLHVGGLNGDLFELTTQLGSSQDQMRLAVSLVGDLGRANGTAAPQVAETAQQIATLALNATAVNHNLGDAGTVATNLERALARGGPILNQYGIVLTADQIKTEALAETHKTSADQLTTYDKAAAGATLALRQLGDAQIRANIEAGKASPELQARAVQQRISNTLAELGKPLIGPFLDLLRSALPLIEQLGELFAQVDEPVIELATAAMPILTVAVELFTISLKPMLDLLGLAGKLLGGLTKHLAGPLAFLGDLTPATKDLGGALGDALGGALRDIVPHFESLTASLGPVHTGISDLASLIDVIGVAAVDRLFTSIRNAPDPMHAAQAAANSMGISIDDLAKIADAAAKQLDDFTGVVTKNLSGVDRALSDLKPNQGLKSFVDNLVSETKRTADFVTAIQTLVDRGATALAGLLSVEGPDALRAAQQAAGLRDDLLVRRETQASQSIEIDQEAIAQQTALAPKLLAAVTDPLAKDGGTEIGKAIAKATAAAQGAALASGRSLGGWYSTGFTAGLNAGAPAIVNAAKDAARGALAASKSALDITSPSRVAAREVGKPFAEGIAKGIDESDAPDEAAKKKVADATKAAAKAATEAAREVASKLFDIQGPATATGKALDLLGPAKLAAILAEFRSGNVTLAEFNRLLAQTGLSSDTLLDVLSETKDAMRAFTDDAVSGLASLEDALNGVKENESLDDFLLRIRQDTVKTAQFLKDINTLVARGADDLAAALLEAGINAAFAAREAAGLSATTLAARERQLEGLELADARNIAGGQRIGSSLAGNAGPNAVGGKIVNQRITVNEVANDPDATARAVSARLAADGTS